jgi:hypothetical protein
LANFYQRIRKRAGAKKARVAVARKLAEICWKRWRRARRVLGLRRMNNEKGLQDSAARTQKATDDPEIPVWRGLACAVVMSGCQSPVNYIYGATAQSGRHEWVLTACA